jgi:hypothetical protein
MIQEQNKIEDEKWELWFVEFVRLYAEALKIEPLAALRHINKDGAYELYREGMTPYYSFRETYQMED